jgi:4a-hydroxytetrahydrobiopterin dehydratase
MATRIKSEEIPESLDKQGIVHWDHCPENLEKGRDAIRRTIVFPDFSVCFSVMSRIAILAEKINHHPEWFNVYNKLDIVLSTHDVGGVSELDLYMAKEIDTYVGSIVQSK